MRRHCVHRRIGRSLAPFLGALALFAGHWLTAAENKVDWQVASGPLLTRWAAEVTPANVHPEYPRPQLVRADWLNLNGLWDYAVTASTSETPTAFAGRILVPFPIESSLSGVRQRLEEQSLLWYRRHFTVPSDWAGRRVRLHFGAVDWQTRVLINGKPVGTHRGGYDPFTLDITDHLKASGEQEILVAAADPTEGDQPRGKQSRKPEGIFYTPSSGIWQTVWLEPVPATCIDELRIVPDVDGRALRVRVGVNSLADSMSVEIVAAASGKAVARTNGPTNQELRLAMPAPHLWTPDDPFLYDLQITLKKGGQVIDTAASYFGMRTIGLRKDARGATRIALNDQFLFQVGALDQGFWPDGIYTAPSDAALRSDIEFLKQAGFNLARKHVKVEPDRWYYWCDKLGLLVWQDMPSGNNATPEGRTQFEAELQRMIFSLRNHPSIVMWVLFNEGWGQYDTERLARWLKELDDSRLVDNASGWTDKRAGDVIDVHSYPGPESPPAETDRAAVLGEFGGLGLGVDGHTWSKQVWGYQAMSDTATLTRRYSKLLRRAWGLRESAGLSAAVYTQTTDVETECNGLLTYDRALCKLDLPLVKAANRGESREENFRILVPNAQHQAVSWKYTLEQPAPDWAQPGFAATGWKEGAGGFGTQGTPGAFIGTTWNTADIWLRRELILDNADLRGLMLQVHHDEDFEAYLNGVLAAKSAGFVIEYYEIPVRPEAVAAFRAGTNILAIHCHQTGGGQYIDAGLVLPETSGGSPAKR